MYIVLLLDKTSNLSSWRLCDKKLKTTETGILLQLDPMAEDAKESKVLALT